jgi:hypothetical protein
MLLLNVGVKFKIGFYHLKPGLYWHLAGEMFL